MFALNCIASSTLFLARAEIFFFAASSSFSISTDSFAIVSRLKDFQNGNMIFLTDQVAAKDKKCVEQEEANL